MTSGEFMAIYAANNILRGIRNYDGDRYQRVAGILLNKRNIPGEDERVRRFAEAVHLPVLARIPRSEAFAKAEEENLPVSALEGFETEKQIFDELAAKIQDELPLYPAEPLTDEMLERIVLHSSDDATAPSVHNTASAPDTFDTQTTESPAAEPEVHAGTDSIQTTGSPDPCIKDEGSPTQKRPPLYGCAFTGSATTAVNLTDAIVIAHSPRSCAFYTWQNISSPGRKSLFNRGILLPSAIRPQFQCTEITQTEAVYGGTEKLKEAVLRAKEKKPGAVIVISSCVSGIIGDDILSVEELSEPGLPAIVLPTDGDISGDYMSGIRMCLHKLADRLVDRDQTERTRSVNLIGEASVSTNLEAKYRMVKDLLARMDITVNCRFLGSASVSDLRDFKKAPLNILAADNLDNLSLKDWLTEEFGCTFLDMPLPTGFEETSLFIRKISEFFHCTEKVADILEEERALYQNRIRELAPILRGKSLLMTTISTSMDWLLSAALDAKMEIVWIGVADYLHQGITISRHEKIQAVTEALFDL